MADPRFFRLAGPFTVAELAARIGAELAGAADPARVILDVAPLDRATRDHLSFLANDAYRAAFRNSRAGALIAHPDAVADAPPEAALLVTAAPYRAFALAAQAFYPEPPPLAGIAPSAVVDPTAQLGEGCAVEPNAVIGARVEIGRRCQIGANAVIGPGCVLGDDVRVGANASLSHCLIGSRVRLYPGVRIGQDGFGFDYNPSGFAKIPQLGRVIIQDDVEIGANTTVDRGAGPDTVIGQGTMIDNLCQIAHNVTIGRLCVLQAQVGISGSTRLGDHVVIQGQGGLMGHLTIGDRAKIGAQCGVMKSVPADAAMLGSPAQPIQDFFRQMSWLARAAKRRGS
jgi:UDP-3-O-[3-hydroxymyristoyl] glucosamine N-acyltransferase